MTKVSGMWKSRRAAALNRVAFVVVAFAVLAPPVAAQQPDLAGVLAKAATYLASYEKAFSVIVAEESYLQTVRTNVGRNRQRTLRSDVLRSEERRVGKGGRSGVW